MISYIIPTRNRPRELALTLAHLAALPHHTAEVIIADNAGDPPARSPLTLANGIPVRVLHLNTNHNAAARNLAARASDPSSAWLVMLDDDSHPLNLDFLSALANQPGDIAALQAEIWLTPPLLGPSPQRESGGLPEVFIGCGVAIRRDAFLASNGYDPTFGFYAEEYDLAARFLLADQRIAFDSRFQVHHRKVTSNRDMDAILRRLVRNNAWVMQRYAPRSDRPRELRRTLARYWSIALKERAELGYLQGLLDLSHSLFRQPRRELSPDLWDRFTGKAACRAALQHAFSQSPFTTARLTHHGKNDHIIRESLAEMGVRLVANDASADATIIAALSPGPMLDARDALYSAKHASRLIAPWLQPEASPKTKNDAKPMLRVAS